MVYMYMSGRRRNSLNSSHVSPVVPVQLKHIINMHSIKYIYCACTLGWVTSLTTEPQIKAMGNTVPDVQIQQAVANKITNVKYDVTFTINN